MSNPKKNPEQQSADGEDRSSFEWGNWSTHMGGLGALWSAVAEAADALPLRRRAFELVPGDIMEVGHTHVYVVGVSLTHVAVREERFEYIQVAGAEARWCHHDWEWQSTKVMEDSPLLKFHPLQFVTVVKPSLLDSLEGCIQRLKSEAKAEDKTAVEKHDAERAQKKVEEEKLRERIRNDVREEILAEVREGILAEMEEEILAEMEEESADD